MIRRSARWFGIQIQIQAVCIKTVYFLIIEIWIIIFSPFQLQLLNDFDICYLAPTTSQVKSKTSNRSKIELAPELIEWVAERPAFIYPELLPTSALKPSGKSGKDDKPYFAKAEDNLIALGKFFYPKIKVKFRMKL